MLILQPPIRTSFQNSAKFIFKKTDDDRQNNLIFIQKGKNPKITVIINPPPFVPLLLTQW